MRGGECMDASGNPQLPAKGEQVPISLDNLLDLTPDQRITLGMHCYNINSLYEHVITRGNNFNPMTRQPVSQEDKTRIRNAYNAYNALHPEAQRTIVLNKVRHYGMDF